MDTEYYNGIFSKKHKRLHQLPLVSPAEKDSDDTCEKQSLNKKESIFTPPKMLIFIIKLYLSTVTATKAIVKPERYMTFSLNFCICCTNIPYKSGKTRRAA